MYSDETSPLHPPKYFEYSYRSQKLDEPVIPVHLAPSCQVSSYGTAADCLLPRMGYATPAFARPAWIASAIRMGSSPVGQTLWLARLWLMQSWIPASRLYQVRPALKVAQHGLKVDGNCMRRSPFKWLSEDTHGRDWASTSDRYQNYVGGCDPGCVRLRNVVMPDTHYYKAFVTESG